MKIRNRMIFLAVIAMAVSSTACFWGNDEAEHEAEHAAIQNYAKQAMSKLEALSAERKQMIDTLGKSVSEGEPKKVRFDKAKGLAALERMRTELDRAQKEFEAIPTPKGGGTFQDGMKNYFDRERSFVEEVSNFFNSGDGQGDRGAWVATMQKPQLLSYQSAQLYRIALTASGEPHNTNRLVQ
ncbi:MAG: hypothetical protein L0229_16600 [Blastocatellia bacterium]|nr:hypothetical protein [Blastocatellia bacterium]